MGHQFLPPASRAARICSQTLWMKPTSSAASRRSVDVLCHEVRLARLSAKLIAFLELVSGVGVRHALSVFFAYFTQTKHNLCCARLPCFRAFGYAQPHRRRGDKNIEWEPFQKAGGWTHDPLRVNDATLLVSERALKAIDLVAGAAALPPPASTFSTLCLQEPYQDEGQSRS